MRPLEEGDVITLFSQSQNDIPTLGSTTVPNGALFDQDIELIRDPVGSSLDVVMS